MLKNILYVELLLCMCMLYAVHKKTIHSNREDTLVIGKIETVNIFD